MDVVLQVAVAAVVGVHYLFLAYLIVGGFLARCWPRTIWLHLVAAAWGSVIISVGAPCPLTAVQNWLRARQDLPPLRTGFIQQYVTGTFYPAGAERVVQVVVGLIVAYSWVSLARRQRKSRGSASCPDVTASAAAATSADTVSE